MSTQDHNLTVDPAWLAPTSFIDHQHPDVAAFASSVAPDSADQLTIAIALFHAVRDGYQYDPYEIDFDPAAFRASNIVGSKRNWCIPKAVLLAAAARHRGVPARLGFADVRNHLTSEKLAARMGTDLFMWHGYTELLLPDADAGCRWFKVSTAFNLELCERFGVKVLKFDGTDDSLMHAYDESGRRHMEYVLDRGAFDDLPHREIVVDLSAAYGKGFDFVHSETGPGAAAVGDESFT